MKASCLDSECISLTPYSGSNNRLKLSPSLYEYDAAADLTCYETFYDDDDSVDKECPLNTNIIGSASWLWDVNEVELCPNDTCDYGLFSDIPRWFVLQGEQEVTCIDEWHCISTDNVEGSGISDLFQPCDVTRYEISTNECGGGPSESRLPVSGEPFELAVAQQVPELF